MVVAHLPLFAPFLYLPNMDRNTIIGMVLIILVYALYMWTSTRQTPATNTTATTTDSLSKTTAPSSPTVAANAASLPVPTSDSTVLANGIFRPATSSTEQFFDVENDLFRIKLTNQGARIYRTELKKYQTYGKQPLILNDGEANVFNYKFYVGQQPVETQQ